MNRPIPRLSGMRSLEERANPAPASAPPARAGRRAALDASIERELRRGEKLGGVLKPQLRDVLNVLVEHELQQEHPATEESLIAASPIFGLFRTARFQHRLARLMQLGLARWDHLTVRPTVAGIGALRPPSALPGSHRPPQNLLRALRRDEIGTL